MDTEIIRSRLGGYNELPPNYQEITHSHFLWLWSVSPASRKYDYRSVKIDNKYGTVAMWVFPDFSGIGWISRYDGRATRADVDAYQAQHFKFAYCEHEFETITQMNCYWEGKCKKCNWIKAVDSGD